MNFWFGPDFSNKTVTQPNPVVAEHVRNITGADAKTVAAFAWTYYSGLLNGGQGMLAGAKAALAPSRKNSSVPPNAGLEEFIFTNSSDIARRLNAAMESLPVNETEVLAMAPLAKVPFQVIIAMAKNDEPTILGERVPLSDLC